MHTRRLTTLLATAILGFAAVPAAASGAVPPGNSGADEYTEGVPGAGGENPSNPSAGGSDSSGGSGSDAGSGSGGSLPPEAVQQLESQGANGAAAAETLNATGPEGGPGDAVSGSSDPSTGSDPASGSFDDAVGSVVGGSEDGLGVALPIILGIALVGAVGVLLARRRGPGTPEAG